MLLGLSLSFLGNLLCSSLGLSLNLLSSSSHLRLSFLLLLLDLGGGDLFLGVLGLLFRIGLGFNRLRLLFLFHGVSLLFLDDLLLLLPDLLCITVCVLLHGSLALCFIDDCVGLSLGILCFLHLLLDLSSLALQVVLHLRDFALFGIKPLFALLADLSGILLSSLHLFGFVSVGLCLLVVSLGLLLHHFDILLHLFDLQVHLVIH